MLAIFKKVSEQEKEKIGIFSSILDSFSEIDRYSYRKKGVFEIICDNAIGELTDPQNQANFNLLAHAWIVIWGKDNAALHVGVTNKIGYRIEIDAAKLYVGHKFNDHEELLEALLINSGVNRQGY